MNSELDVPRFPVDGDGKLRRTEVCHRPAAAVDDVDVHFQARSPNETPVSASCAAAVEPENPESPMAAAIEAKRAPRHFVLVAPPRTGSLVHERLIGSVGCRVPSRTARLWPCLVRGFDGLAFAWIW